MPRRGDARVARSPRRDAASRGRRGAARSPRRGASRRGDARVARSPCRSAASHGRRGAARYPCRDAAHWGNTCVSLDSRARNACLSLRPLPASLRPRSGDACVARSPCRSAASHGRRGAARHPGRDAAHWGNTCVSLDSRARNACLSLRPLPASLRPRSGDACVAPTGRPSSGAPPMIHTPDPPPISALTSRGSVKCRSLGRRRPASRSATRSASPATSTNRSRCGRWRRFGRTSWPWRMRRKGYSRVLWRLAQSRHPRE